MDIDDLRNFLVIARHANLRAAADEVHQTPSALSKAVKRLETSLATPVFDRVGKTLRLNASGERLRTRASELVVLADQTAAEFRGESTWLHCRLLAPSVLQWGFGAMLVGKMSEQQPKTHVSFVTLYEDAALAALARGDGDLALVTGVALKAGVSPALSAVRLGSVRMQLAAGLRHPLAGRGSVKAAELLLHDFACPQRSMFCGLERGSRSDGWREDRLPRKIRFWLDDLHLLITLVRDGLALAYLPDFALHGNSDLVHLAVPDCPYECVEDVFLVWRDATARGWLMSVIESLRAGLS